MKIVLFSDVFQVVITFVMILDAYVQTYYCLTETFKTDELEIAAYIFVGLYHIIIIVISIWLMQVTRYFQKAEVFVDKLSNFFYGVLSVIFRIPIWKQKDIEEYDNPVDYLSLAFNNIPQLLLLNIPMTTICITNAWKEDRWDDVSVLSLAFNTLNFTFNGLLYFSLFRYIIKD